MPLDPQAQAQLDAMAALGLPDFADLEAMAARQLFGSLMPEITPTPVARVSDRVANDVAVRIYEPNRPSGGALVYFHGGGWVIGDLDSHDETCRVLAEGAGVTVIATDYRLAPETPFPGAAEDCYAVTRWTAEHAGELGLDPQRLVVGGDSAGGNLAAVVSLMARDRGGPGLAGQLLIYPVTDSDFDTPSYVENADGYFLTRRAMMWFWNHYVPTSSDRTNPYVAPLRAVTLADLPPALVITAEYDPLRDEGEAYGRALAESGVVVEMTRYDGMLHGFFATPGMDQAARAQQQAIAALNRYVAG